MECSTIPARVIASCFALIGFAAALVVGVAAGNETETVLWRGTVAMAVCWFVGRFIGGIAQQTTEESIEQYKKAHPIEDDHADANDPDNPQQSTGPTEVSAPAGVAGQPSS